MDEAKVSELSDIFRDLADTAGGYERTRIMPNLEVIDTTPSGLPANFIIIKDDEGFYIPALKVAGMTYTNGDLVNVLFIKGAEPIAFQHGSSGSGGYAVHISDEGVDQGNASTLDFVGAGVTAAVAAGTATITISAGGGGWPAAGKAMINNVEYDTVQLAIDAMASGDIIKVGQGTDSGGIVPDTAGAIVGLSLAETIITRSDNSSITVSIDTPDNVTLKNLTVSHTGAGTSVSCIQTNQDGIILDGLNIEKTSGTPTNATGVSVYGGSGAGTYLRNCKITISTGTNKYGVYTSTAANNVVIEGGEINAATADIYIGHASSVVELRGVKLLGGGINNASGGTVKGWYYDSNNNLKAIDTTSDIFPQASVNGLNARFERLFGDDTPAGDYKFSRRLFTINDFVNHKAGFNDSQASPYSFGGSPGGFSLSVPANSYQAESASNRHWLYLFNYHATTPLYVQWTNATAKTQLDFICAIAPNAGVGASDVLVAEIRLWAVQSPSTEAYWALRWVWLGSSKPQYPFRLYVAYGTGTTFSVTNGTAVYEYLAYPGFPMTGQMLTSASGGNGVLNFFLKATEGFDTVLGGAIQSAPQNFKTVQIYIPPANYQSMYLDEVVVS